MKHSQKTWDQEIEEEFQKKVKNSPDLKVELLNRILIEIQSVKEIVEKLGADIQSEPND